MSTHDDYPVPEESLDFSFLQEPGATTREAFEQTVLRLPLAIFTTWREAATLQSLKDDGDGLQVIVRRSHDYHSGRNQRTSDADIYIMCVSGGQSYHISSTSAKTEHMPTDFIENTRQGFGKALETLPPEQVTWAKSAWAAMFVEDEIMPHSIDRLIEASTEPTEKIQRQIGGYYFWNGSKITTYRDLPYDHQGPIKSLSEVIDDQIYIIDSRGAKSDYIKHPDLPEEIFDLEALGIIYPEAPDSPKTMDDTAAFEANEAWAKEIGRVNAKEIEVRNSGASLATDGSMKRFTEVLRAAIDSGEMQL